MRILLASLLTLAALAATATPAQAVAICSNQFDVSDTQVGDDRLAKVHCGTENLSNMPDCYVEARVEYSLTYYLSGLRCDLIQCVTSPCPMATASAALPCATVGSPVLDAGFGVTCSAAGARCSAGIATFGTLEDFLSPSAGCSTGLWPPYDCVQDCDGPATSAQEAPCGASADPLTLSASAVCEVSFCEVGPVVSGGRYDHAVSCWSPLVCVTEPCPGSGRIEI
jgi:hypothetical protein